MVKSDMICPKCEHKWIKRVENPLKCSRCGKKLVTKTEKVKRVSAIYNRSRFE